MSAEGSRVLRTPKQAGEIRNEADPGTTRHGEEDQQMRSEDFFYESPLSANVSDDSLGESDNAEAPGTCDPDWENNLQTRRVDSLRPMHRTVHVLGTNPIGKFIAHSLAGIPDAPSIILFVHHPLIAQEWYDTGQVLRLFKNNQIEEMPGITLESSSTLSNLRYNNASKGRVPKESNVIEHLVVTAHGYAAIPALSAIKHRLRSFSTICFINDGLGIVEDVNSFVFPNPAQRPNYILGAISHLIVPNRQEGNFSLIQQSPGKLFLTMLPRTAVAQSTNTLVNGPLVRAVDSGWSASTPTSTYLMRVLTRSPALDAIGFSNYTYLEMHLQRLSIRAVIDTLSVVFGCNNEDFMFSYHVLRTTKLLLSEISTILLALPEARYMPNPESEFSTKKLEAVLFSTLAKMGKGKTAILHLVQSGKKTDIDYSTGYLIRRANDLGIACPHNEMMLALVKGKQGIMSRRLGQEIPFAESDL